MEKGKQRTGVLDSAKLEQLLHDQRVEIRWSTFSVEFPLNIDLEARNHLPVAPGAALPSENLLLAYYQGRILAEDIYPPPPGFTDGEPDGTDTPSVSAVDTTNIQSYQIREFVEALRGITDDLRQASKGTISSMKQALLGDLSPTALAGQIAKAVEDGTRSSVAAGFQLAELLVCLGHAKDFVEDKVQAKATWCTSVDRAEADISKVTEVAYCRETRGLPTDEHLSQV